MKYCIEVEEIVSIHHQIFVEADFESDLDEALVNAECELSLDDYVSKLKEVVNVTHIQRNYSKETETIECCDIKEEENT